jgi:hypothetical protein
VWEIKRRVEGFWKKEGGNRKIKDSSPTSMGGLFFFINTKFT